MGIKTEISNRGSKTEIAKRVTIHLALKSILRRMVKGRWLRICMLGFVKHSMKSMAKMLD